MSIHHQKNDTNKFGLQKSLNFSLIAFVVVVIVVRVRVVGGGVAVVVVVVVVVVVEGTIVLP